MGPVEYIPRIRQQYSKLGYQPYEWAANADPPPWQPLRRPLARSRLALVASGGIYVTGQVAFHHKDDTSFRAIPANVRSRDLRITHFAYDQTDARADPNVVFPIDTLRALVAEGFVGELAAHAYRSWAASIRPGTCAANWRRASPTACWRRKPTSRCWCPFDPYAISPSD